MQNTGIMLPRRIMAASVIVLICLSIAGCLHMSRKPESAPTPPPASTDQMSALKNENSALKKELNANRQKVEDLEQNIAALKIQILEYEAMVNNMRIRSDEQHQRLDAAIIDVVRAKAKLRSIESKAEAASTIAEAEIAVKSLKNRSAPPDQVTMQEIATAEQLLDMSTQEFKTQNFGGALYLANQSKGLVRTVQMRLSRDPYRDVLEGEASFVQPVPLKVLKDGSNLREGPGLDQRIAGRLKKGELLVGYSYKDRWIRVETQQGLAGWIFQTLVGAR